MGANGNAKKIQIPNTISANIHYLGVIKNINLLYPQADALIHPTLADTYGMAGLEAMAAGLAIVIPPSKENFSEGLEGNVVFTEPNPDSFAGSINELLTDELLRKKFADKAKIKALEFDKEKIEKICQTLLKIFNFLVKYFINLIKV